MQTVKSIVMCQGCFSNRFSVVCSPFVGDDGFDLRCMECGKQTFVTFEFGNGETHFEVIATTYEFTEKPQ